LCQYLFAVLVFFVVPAEFNDVFAAVIKLVVVCADEGLFQ
jgi:hypothetical protein